MARSARAALLETRTARLKLPIRKKPYSVRVSPSLRLGYRRNQTAGVWSVIVADGKGGSWMKKFALADDFEESEGRHVLDYWQAQKQARLLARGDRMARTPTTDPPRWRKRSTPMRRTSPPVAA